METKTKNTWKVILFGILTLLAAIACIFGIVMACKGGDYIIPGIAAFIVGGLAAYGLGTITNRIYEQNR